MLSKDGNTGVKVTDVNINLLAVQYMAKGTIIAKKMLTGQQRDAISSTSVAKK